MKKIYTFVFTFFFVAASFAQTNTALSSGSWSDDGIWSQKRAPQGGDVVEIPAGRTVELTGSEDFSYSKIELKIWGQLRLNNGKLYLGNNSKVTLFEGGTLVTIKQNPADKILIGNVEKYTGAEGTLTGFMMATNTTGTAPNGFMKSQPIILPVKFAAFAVAAKNNAVEITWSTAEEANALYFEVEHSTNGTAWAPVGRVKAAGNSTQLTSYSFTDRSQVAGTVYYRIKQADVDGKAIYTNVQSISSKGAQISITAAHSKVAVQFAQPVKGKTEVLVINRAGQVIARQVVENGAGQVVLHQTSNLKGNYFVAVSNGAGISASQQVVL